MGKFARNKTKVKYSDVDSSASKKSERSHKYQIQLLISRFHPKIYVTVKKQIFLETFGPPENNRENSRQLEDKDKSSTFNIIINITFTIILMFPT